MLVCRTNKVKRKSLLLKMKGGYIILYDFGLLSLLIILIVYIGIPVVIIYFILMFRKMVMLTEEKNKKLERIASVLTDMRDRKSVDK